MIEIEGIKQGKVLVVKIRGRLDSSSFQEFDKRCLQWFGEGENNFIIDFRDVEYISSIGLRSMLSIGKRMKTQNGKLLLCNMNKVIKSVFKMSGFSTIFRICDTLEIALGEM